MVRFYNFCHRDKLGVKLPFQTKLFFAAPPTSVMVGEDARFLVNLKWSPDGFSWWPLENKTVELWIEGSKENECTTFTETGYCVIQKSFAVPGTYTFLGKFWGDGTYDSALTPLHTIIVQPAPLLEAFISVDFLPPADTGVGEPFHIGGELHEDSGPMTGPTLELWEDGVLVKTGLAGMEFERLNGSILTIYGRWRFAAPAFRTLGTHTLFVRFPGDDDHHPVSSEVFEVVVRESEVVPTIENITVPPKVEPSEPWTGYFHLCNRGVGTGNVRAEISGDVTGETPIIVMGPGDCQTVAIGGVGPSIFTIRTGV